MTKYLNFFESESGFTEAVEAGQLFFPNVSYTEEDDTVHWSLTQPADPVETPMLRMSFSTSSPGEGVKLTRYSDSNVTAMEIDGIPVNVSGDTYSIAEPGNHTAVYQFASPAIPERLFRSDSGEFDTFTSAEITSAVTSISGSAFSHCSGLSSVTIPNSVTRIGHTAFMECSGLTSVTIPDSVTSLGQYVFKGCTEMESATIGSGITVIDFQTFMDCTSLQSVTLPDSLTDIDHGAFANCSSLYDINIPSGVTRIGLQAFLGCSGLTAIYFNSETPLSLGANALDYTNDCPIYVPADSVETYQQAWPSYAYRIKTKHRISASVNDDSLGDVDVLNGETASNGDMVIFHVNVFDTEHYEATDIRVHDGNGDEVQYTDEGDGNYSFTMPASDVTIFATLEEKPMGQYNISVDLNDGSQGEVRLFKETAQETANEGDTVRLQVNVFDPENYRVGLVSVTDGNGDEVQVTDEGYDNYYTFTMPASDVTISVVLEEKPEDQYKISTVLNDDRLGHVDVRDSAPEGGQVEFDVFLNDDEQYQVYSVTADDGNGDDVQVNDEGDHHYSFEMPASDVTIIVVIVRR